MKSSQSSYHNIRGAHQQTKTVVFLFAFHTRDPAWSTNSTMTPWRTSYPSSTPRLRFVLP